MITIKNTPNLVGITISGDYRDLDELRDAIADYCQFYLEHQDSPNASECEEMLLGLCYDLRHAYQGDRDYEIVENNAENLGELAKCIYELPEEYKKTIGMVKKQHRYGNLYFSVNVLYPLALYYMYLIDAITEDVYQREWFEDIKYEYDEMRVEKDIALIRCFSQLLWNALKEVLPWDVFQPLWQYRRVYTNTNYFINYPSMYVEWLSSYWVAAAKDRTEREEILPMICLELSSVSEVDEDEMSAPAETDDERFAAMLNEFHSIALKCVALYDLNYEKITENENCRKVPFQFMEEYMNGISEYVDQHGPFDYYSYDLYLDKQFGAIDWDNLEW